MATSTARAPTLTHPPDLTAAAAHRPGLPPRGSPSMPSTSGPASAGPPRSLAWSPPRLAPPVQHRISTETQTAGAEDPPPPSPPPPRTQPAAAAAAPPVARARSPPPAKMGRGAFMVAPIPPFRGGSQNSSSSATALSAASAKIAADPPPTGPSAVHTQFAQTEQAPRRASHPLVFSLPRQDPRPTTGPGARASFSTVVATGLGIAGVGVGAGGAREALVIERVGEAAQPGVGTDGADAPISGNGGEFRRGSLKRVLISDSEDELAAVRRHAAPAEESVNDASLPLPLQPPPSALPPPLQHRESASSVIPQRRRSGSASPLPGHESPPPTANKRRRTSRPTPTPLESLATTASDLLSAAPAGGPARATTSEVSPTSTRPQGGIPLSTLVLGQPVQEQHDRELERRRESANLVGPTPGLAAQTPKPSSRRGSLLTAPQEAPGSTTAAATTTSSSSNLAKRRGHRPPAVATGPPAQAPAAATRRGSYSAAHGETSAFAALRSAPIDIPSVLVGSPMEAAFTARARERAAAGHELPPLRSAGPSSTREVAAPPRRQSQSAAVHPQPPLVSSSSYYIRPNQPLGPGNSFPPPPPPSHQLAQTSSSSTATSPRSGGPAPQDHGQTMRIPSLTRSTGPGRAAAPGPSQPFASSAHATTPGFPGLHPPPAYPPPPLSTWNSAPPPLGGPLSPLPPLSASVPAPGAPGAPLPSPSFSMLPPHSAGLPPPPASLPPHHPHHHQHHQHRQYHHHYNPPHGTRPGSSQGVPPSVSAAAATAPGPSSSSLSSSSSPPSKQAFLSLFSTVYDSLSDAQVLTSSLDSQLARAGQLLANLQHAEAVVETALAEVRREHDRRWHALEERLLRLEGGGPTGGADVEGPRQPRERGGGAAPSTSATSSSSSSPPISLGPHARDARSSLEDRLDRLERWMRLREQQLQPGEETTVVDENPARRGSGDSASSGAGAESEASTGAAVTAAAGGGGGNDPHGEHDEVMET